MSFICHFWSKLFFIESFSFTSFLSTQKHWNNNKTSRYELSIEQHLQLLKLLPFKEFDSFNVWIVWQPLAVGTSLKAMVGIFRALQITNCSSISFLKHWIIIKPELLKLVKIYLNFNVLGKYTNVKWTDNLTDRFR